MSDAHMPSNGYNAPSNAWVAKTKAKKFNRTMVTPEGVPLNISIASAGARAGALALDITIILSLMIGVSLLFLLLLWAFSAATGKEGLGGTSGFGDLFAIVWILTIFLFRNAYFLYFELGDRSATWGKRAMGIRVAARDGGRLTPEAIIARNIVRDIELFLPLAFMSSAGAQGQMTSFTSLAGFIWVLVFLLFPLFNKDRLRAGDLVGGTWVINSAKADLGEVVAPSVSSTVMGAAVTKYEFSDEDLSVYGEFELQTLENVLRADNEEALRTVAETICSKIGWNPGSGDERVFLESYYTALRAKLEREMRFGKRRENKYTDSQ